MAEGILDREEGCTSVLVEGLTEGRVEDFMQAPAEACMLVLEVVSMPVLGAVCTRDLAEASTSVPVVACMQAPAAGSILGQAAAFMQDRDRTTTRFNPRLHTC